MIDPDEPDSATAPERPPSPPAGANDGPTVSKAPGAVAGSRIRVGATTLAVGLAAAVLAWSVGEAALTPDTGLARRTGQADPLASTVGLRNAVVSYGLFGAVLGLGLGLAGALISRSAGRAPLAAATGLILGGATGAGMARLLAPVVYNNLSVDDLTYSLMVHAGSWGAVGAVAGLAFGLGRGRWADLPRIAVGGTGAALLGAVINEFAGGILAPRAMTSLPVSATWQTRLAAWLLVGLSVAVGVALSAGSVPSNPGVDGVDR
jgi:hypothetical protein